MPGNNITRMLDARKVAYRAFELPPEKLSAQQTAQILGASAHEVYKTIVVVREKPGKPILAVIPGDHEVDVKALAAVLREKKVRVPTQAEAETLTGLQAGGISPLALINRGFQMLLDDQASHQAEIHVSGGQRGLNIRLAVKDLLQLTGARLASISHPMSHPEMADTL